MFTDPQSVTINAVATSFHRTGNGPNEGKFTTADLLKGLTIKQNSTAKRFRREARISQSKIAADPISAVNAEAGTSVYIVVDEPRNGVFSDAEIAYLVDGLTTWVMDGTNLDRLLRGES